VRVRRDERGMSGWMRNEEIGVEAKGERTKHGSLRIGGVDTAAGGWVGSKSSPVLAADRAASMSE
jgi:hypothetical protein